MAYGVGDLISSLANPNANADLAQAITPNPNPLAQQGQQPPAAATAGSPTMPNAATTKQDPYVGNLALMLIQNQQRARAAEGINQGMDRMAASFGTAQQQASKMAALHGGGGGGAANPIGDVGDVMKIQQEVTNQNEHARFQANAAVFAKTLGLPLDQTIEIMNDPGAMKMALENATLTGAQKEAQGGASEYAKSKGYDSDPNNWTPDQTKDVAGYKSNLLAGALGGSDLNQRQYLAEKAAGTTTDDFQTWQAKHKAQADILTGQAGDVKDARSALPGYNASLDDMSTRVDSIAARGDVMSKILSDPVKKAAAATLLNAAPGSYSALIGSSGLEANEVKLIDDIRQMKLQNYSANFKSGQRLTQQEASRLGAKADQLSNLELDPASYMQNVGILQKNIKTAHANAYGAANSLDNVPPELRPRLDQSFLPGGVNAVPGTTLPKWATPVPVKSVSDIKALPKGQAYKVVGGAHDGEVHYAGVEDQED